MLFCCCLISTNQTNTLQNTPHLTFSSLIQNTSDSIRYKDKNLTTTLSITPHEFEEILSQLYQNNYILISPKYYINKEDNNVYFICPNIPKNKKPIILSFDNPSYKNGNQNFGDINKIIVDRNNNLASYSTKERIQDRISYNKEHITILESFINNHPDFVYKKSRPLIFFAGANGVLGYNTNSNTQTYRNDTKQLHEVLIKLKSLGYEFGCTNYNYTPTHTQTVFDFAKDFTNQKNDVMPHIDANFYFGYPHNTIMYNLDLHHSQVVNNGFQVFFVPDINKTHNIPNTFTRTHITRDTLIDPPENLKDIIDTSAIF